MKKTPDSSSSKRLGDEFRRNYHPRPPDAVRPTPSPPPPPPPKWYRDMQTGNRPD